jgi:disintegrin and metalloproteinase domain-containing protein 17
MVTVVLFVVISIANGLLTLSPGHPLHTALHYVESLHKDQISSTKLDDGNFRQIEFTTHGRYFRLHLRRSADGLHPNLHQHSNHAIRYDQFYSGRIAGEYGSHVIAHVTDEGVVTAIIRTPQESYYIEPSHPHIKESHDYHMITYKNSDVKYNMTGYAYYMYHYLHTKAWFTILCSAILFGYFPDI